MPTPKEILQSNNTKLNTMQTTTVPNIQQIATNLPDKDYEIVKYPKLKILGQSACYDLGVKYNTNTEVIVKFSGFNSTFSGGVGVVFGVRTKNVVTDPSSTTYTKSFCLTSYNNGNYAYGTTDYALGTNIKGSNDSIQIKLNNTGAYLYDSGNDTYTLMVAVSESSFETEGNIYLGGRHEFVYTDGTLTSEETNNFSVLTFESLEVKQSGTTISRFVPATNHGRVGIYDEIKDNFIQTMDIAQVQGEPIVESNESEDDSEVEPETPIQEVNNNYQDEDPFADLDDLLEP